MAARRRNSPRPLRPVETRGHSFADGRGHWVVFVDPMHKDCLFCAATFRTRAAALRYVQLNANATGVMRYVRICGVVVKKEQWTRVVPK